MNEFELSGLSAKNHKKIINFCSELDPRKFPESVAIVRGNVAAMDGLQKIYERMKKQSKTERGMKKQLKEAEKMILSANTLKTEGQGRMHDLVGQAREARRRTPPLRFEQTLGEGVQHMRHLDGRNRELERKLDEAEKKTKQKGYYDAVLLVCEVEEKTGWSKRSTRIACEALHAALTEAGVKSKIEDYHGDRTATVTSFALKIEPGTISADAGEQALGAIARYGSYAPQIAKYLDRLRQAAFEQLAARADKLKDQRLLGEILKHDPDHPNPAALERLTSGAVVLETYRYLQKYGPAVYHLHNAGLGLVPKLVQIAGDKHQPQLAQEAKELLNTHAIPTLRNVRDRTLDQDLVRRAQESLDLLT